MQTRTIGVSKSRRVNADVESQLKGLMARKWDNEGELHDDEKTSLAAVGIKNPHGRSSSSSSRSALMKKPAAKQGKASRGGFAASNAAAKLQVMKKPGAMLMLTDVADPKGKSRDVVLKGKCMGLQGRLTAKRKTMTEAVVATKGNKQSVGVQAAASELIKKLDAQSRELFKFATLSAKDNP